MSSFGLSVRCSVRSCWFAVLALCLAAGCGGGGGGEEVVTSEVAGKVTVGGKPLTQGRINFVSPEKGVGAGGDLGPEGAYTLEGPLPVGEYKVFITFNLAPSQIGTPAEEILKSIPEKYQSQEASDLSATVEQDRAAYDFEL